MRSTRRRPAWAPILMGAVAAGVLVDAGCSLDDPESRPRQIYNRIGGGGGNAGLIIQPRQCLVRAALIDRPYRDPAINEAIWRVADEQVLAPAERKALEANGLRVGRIIGELPKEIETILRGQGTAGQARVVPSNVMLESGQATLINTTPSVPQVSLLVNKDDRVAGRDYRDASGFLRLTPRHDGARAITLRVVPEIHHGPVQRTFPAVPNTAGLGPQELTIRDGQREDALRELSVDLVLEEGQVAVLGCRPDNLQSLGTFLFSQPTAENDERHQRLILIWASRNMVGVVAEAPKGGDRPKRLRRLVGSFDEPPANPAPPDPTPPTSPGPPQPTPRAPAPRATPAGPAGAQPRSPTADAATPPAEAQAAPPLPGRN